MVAAEIARFVRIFEWVSLKGALEFDSDRPVAVVVVEEGHGLLEKIQSLYTSSDGRRWTRLCQEPFWFFADIFYAATTWDRVIEALSDNLATTVRNPQNFHSSLSVHKPRLTN